MLKKNTSMIDVFFYKYFIYSFMNHFLFDVPSATFAISLNTIDDETLSDKHILTYDNIQFDNFTDLDWTHTLNRGDTNSSTCDQWFTASSKTGIWHGERSTGYRM